MVPRGGRLRSTCFPWAEWVSKARAEPTFRDYRAALLDTSEKSHSICTSFQYLTIRLAVGIKVHDRGKSIVSTESLTIVDCHMGRYQNSRKLTVATVWDRIQQSSLEAVLACIKGSYTALSVCHEQQGMTGKTGRW